MDALLTARSLDAIIMEASEVECEKLLAHEKATRKRRSILLRLHSRLNALRAHREREELKALAE